MCCHFHVYYPAKLSKVPLFQGQMVLFLAPKVPPTHLSANCTNYDYLQLLPVPTPLDWLLCSKGHFILFCISHPKYYAWHTVGPHEAKASQKK